MTDPTTLPEVPGGTLLLRFVPDPPTDIEECALFSSGTAPFYYPFGLRKDGEWVHYYLTPVVRHLLAELERVKAELKECAEVRDDIIGRLRINLRNVAVDNKLMRDGTEALLDRVKTAEADRDWLRAGLREVQFNGLNCCISCCEDRHDGCLPDCRLAALLKE